MSDSMDSDVREVIRRRIELRERDGHERLLLNHDALRALLDAADERDRLAAERDAFIAGIGFTPAADLVELVEPLSKRIGDAVEYRQCAEELAWEKRQHEARMAEVRRLQDVVERVRALHVPFRIYGECECEDTTTPGHVDIEEVGITCNLLYTACRECCTSGADYRYQTEDCADGHDHRDTHCPTVTALDGDEQ